MTFSPITIIFTLVGGVVAFLAAVSAGAQGGAVKEGGATRAGYPLVAVVLRAAEWFVLVAEVTLEVIVRLVAPYPSHVPQKEVGV